MKNQKKIIEFTELLLIVFVWLVLLLTPVLFREGNNKPLMESVLKQFITLIPITILLLFNRFFLVPRLLFKGMLTIFLFTVIGLIGLMSSGIYFYESPSNQPPPGREEAGQPDRISPAKQPRDNSVRPEPPPPPDQPGPSDPVPSYANFLILSLLMTGFDTGLLTILKWSRSEKEKAELERENVKSQLLSLKNQISPHFFMNTLNNIHSLVDINSEEAKMAIIQFSKMMDYLLFYADNQMITLKKEVEFVENYINLMKLRFSEKVKIIINFPSNLPDRNVPPLLLISIIEKVFEHGVSYKERSVIHLDLTAGNDRLLFIMKNSKNEKLKMDDFAGNYLLNVRKRLELLFVKNFSFDIIDTPDFFTINLSIPL